MSKIAFWYDFASTYSYLSAMRIEALAASHKVHVSYHPFLLGPIFKAQGLDTSPFVVNPAKGHYMVRDIERISASRGLPFHMPEPFPAHSLNAARIGMVAVTEGWIAPFTKAIFAAEFADRADIAAQDVLDRVVADLGHDPARVTAAASTPESKMALREATATAGQIGIFGAPTFIAPDGELFWGDDRLEQALAWAKNSAQKPVA